MDNRIKSAFSEIKAEQELKTSTKYFLYEKYNPKSTKKQVTFNKKLLIGLYAILIFVLCTGILTYNVPVSAISLDTDKSAIELAINCFDKVVSVDCYGDSPAYEEKAFRNLSYNKAVSIIMENEKENEPILTVSCKNSDRCKKISDEIKKIDSEQKCHTNNNLSSSEAKKHGISTGKYNAYLLLKELDPKVSVDEIKELSMSEIRERIDSLSPSGESTIYTAENPAHSSTSAHGNGHQHGNGHR